MQKIKERNKNIDSCYEVVQIANQRKTMCRIRIPEPGAKDVYTTLRNSMATYTYFTIIYTTTLLEIYYHNLNEWYLLNDFCMQAWKITWHFFWTIICILVFDEFHSMQSCSAIITWECAQKLEGKNNYKSNKIRKKKERNVSWLLTWSYSDRKSKQNNM